MQLKNLRKKQILELCNSLLGDYRDYLNENDMKIINFIYKNLDTKTENIDNLLLIVEKIWNIELNSGNYKIISWNKYSKNKEQNIVTFATISKHDNIKSFCNLKEGIEYKISFKSLIAALPKDAATLIEDFDKKNQYTLKIIKDKVINSYNGATKFITPLQLINSNYKYNELILDTRYIEEIGTVNLLDDIEELYKLCKFKR